MTSPELKLPKILIATGTTCSGKSTLVENLIINSGFQMVGALTTRPERPSDLLGEFNYLTNEEFDALPQEDMIFSTKHGSPSRYTFLRSAVKTALADPSELFTRPLSPSSAGKVVAEFGKDLVKVIYLPTPDATEFERRVIERGDDPADFVGRKAGEATWDELARNTPGIHIAEGISPEELHREALSLMVS